MKLHLIRHAETNANQSGQLSCIPDEQLNSSGILQSHALKQYLSRLTLDEIWCSPLLRSRQTLQPFKACCDIPIKIEPLLSEGHLNLDSDQDIDVDSVQDPALDESTASFRGRCMKLLHKIQNLEQDQTIVALTHGHTIREFLNLALAIKNYTRFPVGNVSDTLVEFSECPVIHYVNRKITETVETTNT